MEQDLKMRVIRDKVTAGFHDNKEEIIEVFMALQHQNFVLGNSLTNLVEQWPKAPPIINEVPEMFGILLETKD